MQNYLDLIQDIMQNGRRRTDRTGVGTISVFGRQFRHSMKDGFPLLTTKRLPFRWIAEELRWFLSGSTNEADLRKVGVDIWKEWATKEECARFGRKEGDLGPIYGALWRQFPIGPFPNYDLPGATVCLIRNDGQEQHLMGCDQVTAVISDIINEPYSRRMLVSGWHPFYQRRVSLPPCHTVWQIYCEPETKEMSLHLYARSIDAFLGLPFNIASYALLLSLLAITTDYTPRDLIISFGDLHVYQNHVEQVRTQMERKPRPLPQLVINERLRNTTFEGMLGADNRMSPPAWTINDLSLRYYDPHDKIEAPVAV